MNKYKVVIFDFDFTLGDSSAGVVKAVNYAMDYLGEPHPADEEIYKTIGMDLFDTYYFLTGKKDNAVIFDKKFMEYAIPNMINYTEIYPGVKEILRKLRSENIKIAVCTSKRNIQIQKVEKKFSIEGIFDVVMGYDMVEKPKPNPEGILKILDTLSLNANDAVYIGDSITDAKAAESADVDFVGVTTGATSIEKLSEYKSIAIVDSLEKAMLLI